MKVLWFTPTPSLAENMLSNKPKGAGWIKSLERQFIDDDRISLRIAFYNREYNAINESSNYYPINVKRKNKLVKIISKYTGKLEPNTDTNLFISILNDFNPDVVHIFGTENPFGDIINQTNIPVIIYMQGVLSIYKTKYYNGKLTRKSILKAYNLRELIKGRSIIFDKIRFNKMTKREETVLSNERLKYILCGTDWDKRFISVVNPRLKVYHIDAVMRDSFYKNSWNNAIVKGKSLSLFTTFSGGIYKGLETIFEASNLLRKKDLVDFEWNIAGINKRDKIVRICEKIYKIDSTQLNINYLGKLDEKSLVKNLLNSNIFVHPSHIDNWPTSVSEAMLLGIPIIATYVGGTGSLMKDKVDGILIQDGDPWAMAGAILELKNNSNLARKYGENAQRNALARHNPEKIAAELINIYLDVINLK